MTYTCIQLHQIGSDWVVCSYAGTFSRIERARENLMDVMKSIRPQYRHKYRYTIRTTKQVYEDVETYQGEEGMTHLQLMLGDH